MKYTAFISYRHSLRSRPYAEHLETAVKRYAKPLWKPPIAIFRDERVLRPGDNLPKEIRRALENSRFLIYIASKEAAESEWVKDELRIWCDELKQAKNLIVVHISDRISVDQPANQIVWSDTDALPSLLEQHLDHIPFWVDLTWVTKDEHLDLSNVTFLGQINGLVARFRGIQPGEMNDAEVITHRRNVLVRNAGIAVILIFGVLALWFGIVARRNAILAEEQRDVATAKQYLAESSEVAHTRPSKMGEATRLAMESDKTKPSPDATFVLRERLDQLARPVPRNGIGFPLIVFSFFSDSQARLKDDGSGQLGFLAIPPGQSLSRLGDPVNLPRARVSPKGGLVTAKAGKLIWEREGTRQENTEIDAPNDRLFDVAFTQDGQPRVALQRDATTAEVCDLGKTRMPRVIRNDSSIYKLVFSGDGRWIAVAHFGYFDQPSSASDAASSVTIWDAESGRQRARFLTSGQMYDFAFSPTGDRAAALTLSGVILWDVKRKALIREWSQEAFQVTPALIGSAYVAFSADGKWLGAIADNRLRVWNTEDGSIRVSKNLDLGARWITFNEKGNLAALSDQGGGIEVWDLDDGQLASVTPTGMGRKLIPMRFGHLDQMLQVTDQHGDVRLWQIKDEQESWQWESTALQWLPDSRSYLIAENNTILLWSAEGGSVALSNEIASKVYRIAIRPDGKMTAAADRDGAIQFFTLPSLSPGKKFSLGGFPYVVEWSSDGKLLATVGGERLRLWLWAMDDFQELKADPAPYGPAKIVFSPDCRYFTAGYDPHNYGDGHSSQLLQLWDARTGKIVRQIPHGTMPEFLAFTPDSQHLISSAEGLIRIWNVPSLTEFARWKVDQGFHNIALSPDGTTIAAAVEGKVEVRKVPSGALSGSLTPMGTLGSIGFSPDSKTIVGISGLGSDSAVAQFWSWPGMEEISRFGGLAGNFPAISFSPNGKYLVLQQIGGVERYLWQPNDLIAQGCRTLLVINPKSQDLSSLCSTR